MLGFTIASIATASCTTEKEKDSKNSAINVSKKLRPFPFIVLPLSLFLFFLESITPTTKQMAAIIVVPKIVNSISRSEILQNLPERILNLADEWITEISPKKNNEPNP